MRERERERASKSKSWREGLQTLDYNNTAMASRDICRFKLLNVALHQKRWSLRRCSLTQTDRAKSLHTDERKPKVLEHLVRIRQELPGKELPLGNVRGLLLRVGKHMEKHREMTWKVGFLILACPGCKD